MDGSRSLTAMLASSPTFAAMGEPVERIRQELIAWGRELQRSVDAAYAGSVSQALQFLDSQSCRVAVIGQVKAGKSSFISALVGRPSLLPSDVNPWTTVVTNLHFYNTASPTETAIFTMFEAGEWNRIAESGGALRDLTERLVPGFDAELLKSQLRSMRARAEHRLGPDFHALLGQRHSFGTINAELLARYVSAGPEGGSAEDGDGWYSDITKTADLYFGGERTGFPITIVDTPGTNDPLLVRDEITRLSLSTADIYVVVLTAQQPLSVGDLALLRLLRGLHKERIVIFINRIDALGDVATGAARLVEHVESRLRDEFPGIRFPIIAGSARWANGALSPRNEETVAAIDPAFRAYASSRGYGELETILPGRRPSASTVTALMTLSGIPAVAESINRLMTKGNAAHALKQLTTYFRDLARSSETSRRAQSHSIGRALNEARAGSDGRAREIVTLQRELEQLDLAGKQLQANLNVYEDSLRSLVERCASDLRLLLGRCTERFVQIQTAEMTRAYRERSSKVWACHSTPLRDDLQSEFMRVYHYWEGQLKRADTLIRAQLRAIMPAASLHGAETLPGSASSALRYPDVSALGRTLALDLSAPWWVALWRGRLTLESRVEELKRLITLEFAPLVEELVKVASTALSEQAQHASRQARVGTIDIVNSIQQRSAELVAQMQRQDTAGSPEMLADLDRQWRESAAALQQWTRLRTGLSNLVGKCDSTFQDPVPPSA